MPTQTPRLKFTTTKEKNSMSVTTTPATNAALPHGFDDESSPFYVPEPLRRFYSKDLVRGEIMTSGTISPDDVASSIAHDRAISEMGQDAYSRPKSAEESEAFFQRRAAIKSSVQKQEQEHLMLLSFHYARLSSARSRFEADAVNEQIHAQTEYMHTCPVCGHFNRSSAGAVEERTVTPWVPAFYMSGDPSIVRIRSCALCAHIATTTIVAAASTARTADGSQSRAEAVSSALEVLQ